MRQKAEVNELMTCSCLCERSSEFLLHTRMACSDDGLVAECHHSTEVPTLAFGVDVMMNRVCRHWQDEISILTPPGYKKSEISMAWRDRVSMTFSSIAAHMVEAIGQRVA